MCQQEIPASEMEFSLQNGSGLQPNFSASNLRLVDALLRASPDAVMVMDRQGRYLYVSVAAAQALGIAPETMPGKTFVELGLPPETASGLDLQRLQAFATGQPVRGEADIPTVQGMRRYEYTMSPIRDEAGAVQAVLCIARDITARRNLEAEQRYITAAARCLLWYADIEDNGDYSYLCWDLRPADEEAAQRFLPLEVRAGERYKDAWYRCRPVEDRDHCDRIGAAAVRAGRSYEQEYRCTNRNGAQRWLHEDVRVETLEPGRKWRAVGVCTDITERKQHEEENLALNRRMNRAMQETHHRVKNNLQLIAAMLDMAQMEHPEGLPLSEVQRLSLQVQALASIHDILTGNTHSGSEQTDRISARVILLRLMTMLTATAERHRIEHEIADISVTLRQATALALAANELVSNAVKHGRAWARARFLAEGSRRH